MKREKLYFTLYEKNSYRVKDLLLYIVRNKKAIPQEINIIICRDLLNIVVWESMNH